MTRNISSENYNVSLIIVQYGEVELLKKFLASLESHPDLELINEIIIVNNGYNSLQKSDDYINRLNYPVPIKVINNTKNSYTSGLNLGVSEASGEILILANNDLEFLHDYSIKNMLDHFTNDKVGIIGSQLVFPNGSWQLSYGNFPSTWTAVRSLFLLDSISNIRQEKKFNRGNSRSTLVDYIDGAFMCVKRKCFESCNGFDESFDFYTEETDLCYRAKKLGWKILFEPSTRIIHVRGATSIRKQPQMFQKKLLQSQIHFVEKHSNRLKALIYKLLMIIALTERAILYSMIALFSTSNRWKERSQDAITRWKAIF